MVRRDLVLVALLLFAFAGNALAQGGNAQLGGTVQDPTKALIPGVTITASSASLIGGNRTAYTNASGFFRFPVLANGLYEVKAELGGFQTVTRKEIFLSIGTTLTVDFTLQILQVSERIQVSGETPLIDTTTTAVSSTVPAEIVSNLPRRADIESLLALTPGVSDDLVAFGAPNYETSFWVDGVYGAEQAFLGRSSNVPHRKKEDSELCRPYRFLAGN